MMKINKRMLISALVALNIVFVIVLASVTLKDVIPQTTENLNKVEIVFDVNYNPLSVSGFTIPAESVDIKQSREGISGFLIRAPMSVLPRKMGWLNVDNVKISMALGGCTKTKYASFKKLSTAGLGDTKNFKFTCRKVPSGLYPVTFIVTEGGNEKVRWTDNVDIGQ